MLFPPTAVACFAGNLHEFARQPDHGTSGVVRISNIPDISCHKWIEIRPRVDICTHPTLIFSGHGFSLFLAVSTNRASLKALSSFQSDSTKSLSRILVLLVCSNS